MVRLNKRLRKREIKSLRSPQDRIMSIKKPVLADVAFLLTSALIFAGICGYSQHWYERHHPIDVVRAAATQVATTSASMLISPVSFLPTPQPTPKVITVIKEDRRVTKLNDYLTSKSSPLAPYAQLIVSQADQYDIGWTKIVSISAMESSYGLSIPQGSYNAWGIGGRNFMYFNSWEDGIKYVSKLLGENYKWNENAGIQSKYCPAWECNPDWSTVVTQASDDVLATVEASK